MFCRDLPALLGLSLLLSPALAQQAQSYAAEGVGGTAPGQEAVAQLEAVLRQTSSLSAEVEQLLIDQDGRELQETEARLMMRKPASFYWEITEPYAELMVTDGELIWRYEPDLEQVTIQRFNDELDRTPVMLLNGAAADIAESYSVELIESSGGELRSFVLYPRKPDSLFERLSLSFRGPELVEMQFEDSLGQKTSLSFSQLERNGDFPPGQFSFVPPDDIDIIDTTLP